MQSNNIYLKNPRISKLFSDPQQRQRLETMSEIYGIFAATDQLERLWVRDVIAAEEYSTTCSKLISQYKTAVNFMGKNFNIEQDFLIPFSIQMESAKRRLVDVGVPATIEHAVATARGSGHVSDAIYIAKTVESFILGMDLLTLGIKTVERIHPCLSNLIDSLRNLSLLPDDFEAKAKICKWIILLNSKADPSEELSELEMKQLAFDLESGMHSFMNFLNRK
jgi:ESCRT-I complex subunit VPS28